MPDVVRGTQTIATAQSLVQLRSVIPLSKLRRIDRWTLHDSRMAWHGVDMRILTQFAGLGRYRFRLLSRDLQQTLRIRPVPYEEQVSHNQRFRVSELSIPCE